ncbi:hypothetical protein VE03_01816 [Pseudogymnoascus sp. 23342-1-I1]|nr:hypothetical protein VE03_01816 [Pseudogymnoascus sp. 23342-1-I1]
MIQKCPDAIILVAMIISTTRPAQAPQTAQYQALIPGAVQTRAAPGKHVIAVDFTKFSTTLLRDGIHPTDGGYRIWATAGTNVKWLEQGGITAGSGVSDLDTIIFAVIDGDGQDSRHYLIFDDEAGISRYLNVMTQKSGAPLFAKQEGNQPIATSIENTTN